MKVQIIKQPVTWIVVADGRSAQIYTRKAVEKRIPMAGNGMRHHMAEFTEAELSPVLAEPLVNDEEGQYQTGRNQTGMVFESHSSARHMAEPHIDARREVKQHFAQRVAHLLNTSKRGKAFDRLVLVAPPNMLGEIEAGLHEDIHRKITAKLANDLTSLGERELTRHLSEMY